VLEIRRIKVLRCGIVSGVLYAFGGLFEALFMGPMMAWAPSGPGFFGHGPLVFVGVLVLFPLLFAVIGFISGVIMAALYNLVVGWTGGLQFEVDLSSEPQIGPA